MNPFEMVLGIILIITIGKVLQSRYKHSRGQEADGATGEAGSGRLRDEVRALKERVAVLERVITDESGPRRLDREIEALRSRDA